MNNLGPRVSIYCEVDGHDRCNVRSCVCTCGHRARSDHVNACTVDGCDREFKTPHGLTVHMGRTHGAKPAKLDPPPVRAADDHPPSLMPTFHVNDDLEQGEISSAVRSALKQHTGGVRLDLVEPMPAASPTQLVAELLTEDQVDVFAAVSCLDDRPPLEVLTAALGAWAETQLEDSDVARVVRARAARREARSE